jgi:rare lipoprotein A
MKWQFGDTETSVSPASWSGYSGTSVLSSGTKLACVVTFASMITNQPATAESAADAPRSFSGNISWYGAQFNGKRTASGEIFDMNKLTAAHLTLPFQTKVLVEDPRTGNSVVVKVNDRGPFVRTRIMDVAREGARRLGILGRGVTYVDCLILKD